MKKILLIPALIIGLSVRPANAQFDGPRPGTVTPPGGSPPQNAQLVSGVPFHGLLLNSGSIKMSDEHTNELIGYSTNDSETWFCDVTGAKRLRFYSDGGMHLIGPGGTCMFLTPGAGAAFGIGPALISGDTGLFYKQDNWKLANQGQKVLDFSSNAFYLESGSYNFYLRYPTNHFSLNDFIEAGAATGLVKFRDTNGTERLWWSPNMTGFKTQNGAVEMTLSNNLATVFSPLNVIGTVSGNGVGLTNASAAFATNAATTITANGTILITNATTGKIFKLVAQQMN